MVVPSPTGYGVGADAVGYMVGAELANSFKVLKPTSFLFATELAPLTNSALAFSPPTIRSPA